jgi:BON domain
MADAFFGSGAPVWSAMPTQALGWFQAPMPVGNRPIGGLSTGMAPGVLNMPVPGAIDPYGLNGGLTNSVAYPGSNGPDMGPSTAPVLVATVAMRRGQPLGPSSDQEIEDFICDALDLLPGANDVEVRCEGSRATLTGNVQHKRVKRDAGEIAWAIPGINDVQNNVTITPRRRSRSTMREAESTPALANPGRKQT